MSPDRADQIRALAARHAGLTLVVLYGSRGREDAREASDWDIGYLAEPGFDPAGLLADIVTALGTDRVDLVDLASASGQLRFRAAREGRPLYERPAGAFARFWLEAVSFWCDAGPVIRAGYAGVLADLER